MYTVDSPILGTPQASPDQCSRFILRRAHGAYSAHDIADVIVPAYWSVCASVGVEPVLVLAQVIHETGNLCSWWSQRPRRNPAGIGVTGRVLTALYVSAPANTWAQSGDLWKEGCSFASWEHDAIPAHVGRLLAYCLRDSQACQAQRALIRQVLAVRSLPSSFRGVAPTWRGLNGRWASPGATYADSIAEIANAIGRR